MHIANMKMWVYCEKKYTPYFNNAHSIIEFGSHNVNGTVRNLFSNYKEYIGVDWRAGPNVDHVSFAHEVPWSDRFDTVISSSLLEHDPYWEKTLSKMVEVMKSNGILLLSWGAALNPRHCDDHAPDKKFHPLPVKLVIDKLEEMSMYIHEFRYEGKLAGVHPSECVSKNGLGEVFLVAFKDEKYAIGDSYFDELMYEDTLVTDVNEITSKVQKDKPYFKDHADEMAMLRKKFPKPL